MDFVFEPYHYWIIAALICFIIEIFTAGFAIFCFSIGALCGALLSWMGAGVIWQVVFFAVGTFISFAFIRPFVLKFIQKKNTDELKTNADALIGKEAMVIEAIDNNANKGRVAIDGDTWKAVSENGEPIALNEKVEVVRRDSIVLYVKLKEIAGQLS